MTLSVRALLEKSSLRPTTREELHLLVDVTATGAPVDAVRPSLSVVFVLDASGSMGGTPLEHVIKSVEMLVDLLGPDDKVGVVAFSDDASEVCALKSLSAEHVRVVKRRVRALHAQSGTNIEAGLVKARGMLGARTAHERQVILLLSDGAPNVGASSPAELARVVEPMRADASVSTLGYGANHNSDVLHEISRSGGGQYWFIPDPQEAGLEFARAVGAQGDVVADNIDLTLAPADGVEIVEVLGQKLRFTKDGPTTTLPDLREKQTRLVVAKLVVDARREPGRMDIVDVRVRYRAAGKADVMNASESVKLDVVEREPALVVEVHQAARMGRAEIVRVEARAAADRGHFDQAAGMLRAMIKELEAVPGYAAADGSPLSECVEQLIDEATEYEQRPSAERLAMFKATQLGVDVSQGAKHAAAIAAQSVKSAAIMAGATGPALPGDIVVKDRTGREVARSPILPEVTVGRAPANELCIAAGSFSRRHTRFVCRDGKVIVVDLASTNGTFLNDVRLRAPTIMRDGDKVRVGDFIFELDLKK